MKTLFTRFVFAVACLLTAGLASAGSVNFTFDGYFGYSYIDSNGDTDSGTEEGTVELCVYFDDVDFEDGSYQFFGTWDWWTLEASGDVQSISTPLLGSEYPSLHVVDNNFAEVIGGGLYLNGGTIEEGFAGYANVAFGQPGDPGWSYEFEIAGAIDSLLGLNNFIASESYYTNDGSFWSSYELLYCLELTNVDLCADCTPPSENVVPEPATMTLLGLGLGGLALRRYRRR